MTVILYITSFIFATLFLYTFFKYIKIKSVVNELNKPLRKGYYKETLTVSSGEGVNKTIHNTFEPIIYVFEVDRYTSGESKIKIDYIEPGIDESKISKIKIETVITQSFKSIVKTSDINWLDSELSIKEMRREKLSKIKKSLK